MPSGIDVEAPFNLRSALMNTASGQENPHPSQVSPHSASHPSTTSSSVPEEDDDGKNVTESVEVVLNAEGTTKVMPNESVPDQNVFRHPQSIHPSQRSSSSSFRGGPPTLPTRGGAGPRGTPYPRQAMYYGSGSWGYGQYRGPPPPPHHLHHYPQQHQHYPNSSGSFDEQASNYHSQQQQTPHFSSPHVQYPGPRFPTSGEEVNVISPNHKTDPQQPANHATLTSPPRSRPPYYYPPASPVSRPGQTVPPRLRSYAMRRSERSYHRRPEYDWHQYHAPVTSPVKEPPQQDPPMVADSFDSNSQAMQVDTPKSNAITSPKSSIHLTPSADPHVQFYGSAGSWGSFDSAVPHFDDRQMVFPPDSPYSPYPPTPFSPGGLYPIDSFPSPYGYGPPPPAFSYSHDDHEERMLRDYHPDQDKYSTARRTAKNAVTGASANANLMLLPKAAEEVDFDVADPPAKPVTVESKESICESLSEVNGYDVLCGRGGGTNSQIGNRRFRQLVQEFQPIYLVAKRKEKPLLARTIVLIIRKRGGRFLKKDEKTGALFEVGDERAEAKTSQALREGLDVRATRSSQLASKKKKKSSSSPTKSVASPVHSKSSSEPTTPQTSTTSPVYSNPHMHSHHPKRAESPPPLPKLQGEAPKVGLVHPHSPDHSEIRKRRRVRATERFVGDFLPPRADITRPEEDDGGTEDKDMNPVDRPDEDEGVVEDGNVTPVRRNSTRDDSSDNMDCSSASVGCAGIALDVVTGAAVSGFCLGPKSWRR